jgi:glycosyltransferase involved in cell wall biosynthesis
LSCSPTTLRVCHLSATALNGHYFRTMARGLSAEGAGVKLVSLGEVAPPPWWPGDLDGVDYLALGCPSRYRYPWAVLRLARLLRRWRIDVLQTHLFDGAMVGIPAARLARVPLLIVTRHHYDQHWRLSRRLHVRVDRLMARLADRVIVPSRAVRELMVSREGGDGSRIQVIHHGLDSDEFAAEAEGRDIREELGLGDAFVVGCVGRLDAGKGLAHLLAAAGRLQPEIADLRVLIVGAHPDPANRQAILLEARRLELEDRVVLTGQRGDVAACMAAMDVLAHPSLSEALGQVLIEAMAVGLPVVASDVGGIPEVVRAGQTGLLVPPGDPVALADAIMTLYRDPALRGRYAAEGRSVARRRFSAERMVAEHLDCYRRWLRSEPDRRARSR